MALTAAEVRWREYRRTREKEWQVMVRGWLGVGGWESHVVYDSRRSPEGWPDLFALHVRLRLLLVMELKTEAGTLRKGQRRWLAIWRTVAAWPATPGGLRVVVGCYRPHQTDELRAYIIGASREAPESCDEPVRMAA